MHTPCPCACACIYIYVQGLVADHGSDVWWEKEEAELLPPSHAAEARRTTEPGPLLALSLLTLSLLALSLLTLSLLTLSLLTLSLLALSLLALSLLTLSLLALSLTLSPPLTQAGSPVEEGHRHHGRVV